jgi:phospholipid transport system substrate-binding protein
MVNRILSTFLLVFLLGNAYTATPARAQDEATKVQKLLEQRDDEIKQVLGDKKTLTDAQRDQLKDVINRGIDFEGMAQIALGSFWSETAQERRSEFVDVFSEIVRAQSLSNLDVYRSTVKYESVSVEGDSAHVVTTTVYKDVPTEVRYALNWKDGEWRVVDIVLDDVSTADGYARSFQTVIRKKGFDALMASLNKKLESMAS